MICQAENATKFHFFASHDKNLRNITKKIVAHSKYSVYLQRYTYEI